MKFTTGSSSSSLASDSLSRKSTLCIYTEVETPICEKMDSGSETMELRRELDAVRSALRQQSESVLKQRHQLVEASHKLATRDEKASRERKLRQDQLALVLRSLVMLESRLTREQKQIHVALQQKEKIIKAQQDEILKLKARKSYCTNCQQILGFTSEQTNIETDPEFQSLESTDSRYQNGFTRSCSYSERIAPSVFQKNTRLSKSFQLPKNDVVYGNTSSSEEGNNATTAKGTYVKNKQAFVRKDVIRRSRKFSGRNKTNPYLEKVQKRYNSQANSSSADECMGMSYQVNDDTSNQIANDIRRASLKIDQLIEETNKRDNETYNEGNTYAFKMESLHGIRRQTSEEINANRTVFLNNVLNEDSNEKPWYVNISDPEQEDTLKPSNLSYSKSKSADNILLAGFDDGILNAEVISAKNEVLCNSILNKGNKFGEEKQSNIRSLLKNKSNTDVNENWYASASDQDEGASCEIYKNNPVLECVNQILLQNSLDDSSNENSKASDVPSPKASAKRVQFSTLNSISYDDNAGNNGQNNTLPRSERRNKIVKFSLETASEHSYEIPNTAQGYNYEIQSIYSNDYEPIITRTQEPRPVPLPRTISNNLKSEGSAMKGSVVKNIAANIENKNLNHYVDVDKRLENDLVPMKIVNKRKVPRTPPALPPKPKNLVSKHKTDISAVKTSTDNSDAVANQRIAEVKTRKVGQVAKVTSTLEPDYCSISEINVPVVSHNKRELLLTQPTVEIHNEQYPTPHVAHNCIAKVVSLPRIQSKISDKDIPKLPQVTEIIIPDEDDPKILTNINIFPTSIRNDTYLLNKPLHALQPKLDTRKSVQIGNSVSSILSEINKSNMNGEKPITLSELDNQYTNKQNQELHKAEYFDDIDKFDLSQNFEEFKIDDELITIDAEEYRISSSGSDGSATEMTENINNTNIETEECTNVPENVTNNYRVEVTVEAKINQIKEDDMTNEAKNASSKLSNKPDLLSNIDNLETDSVRNSDIESSNSSGSNSGSYNTVKCEPRMLLNNSESYNARASRISFDFFLETSGLSSKSIVTPTRAHIGIRPPNANHKNVLKPKDIKMRVKNPVTTNKINEKTTAIKYFEPYL